MARGRKWSKYKFKLTKPEWRPYLFTFGMERGMEMPGTRTSLQTTDLPTAFPVSRLRRIPLQTVYCIRLEGPEDPHLRNSRFWRSRDPAHASIPLAQTPWCLTGRAWLQTGAQRVVIVVLPSLNSLRIDSSNGHYSELSNWQRTERAAQLGEGRSATRTVPTDRDWANRQVKMDCPGVS